LPIWHEPELLARKAGLFVRPRRAAECAVEPVRPRVVRALERLALALAHGDRRPAVAAHVHERAQLAVSRARDHYGCHRRPAGEVRARLRQQAEVPDVLPRWAEDQLTLATEDLRIGVPAVRKRGLHGEKYRSWCLTPVSGVRHHVPRARDGPLRAGRAARAARPSRPRAGAGPDTPARAGLRGLPHRPARRRRRAGASEAAA